MYLPDSIFYQTVTGSYVDMDEIENQYTEGDMVLKPDFSSATAAPWTGDVTLQIIHDVSCGDHLRNPCDAEQENNQRTGIHMGSFFLDNSYQVIDKHKHPPAIQMPRVLHPRSR